MPVYEYQCKACGRDFEYQQRMSDPDKTVCEACGGALDRLISRTAFSLKGGGWYKDLYASPKPEGGKSETAAKSDAPAASSDSSSSGTSGSTTGTASSGSSGSGGSSSSGSSSGGSSGSGSSSSGGGGSTGGGGSSVAKAS